jgi:hypothetical protein
MILLLATSKGAQYGVTPQSALGRSKYWEGRNLVPAKPERYPCRNTGFIYEVDGLIGLLAGGVKHIQEYCGRLGRK